MKPTTDPKDIEYAISLVKMHPDCFSGVSKSELSTGFLFVDRVRGVMLHIRPETRTGTYGVKFPFGSNQITHIASAQKGVASEYLKEYISWSGGAPIWLFVKTDNKRAIAFYERFGFEKKNIVKFPTFSSFIMVRPRTPV